MNRPTLRLAMLSLFAVPALTGVLLVAGPASASCQTCEDQCLSSVAACFNVVESRYLTCITVCPLGDGYPLCVAFCGVNRMGELNACHDALQSCVASCPTPDPCETGDDGGGGSNGGGSNGGGDNDDSGEIVEIDMRG